MIIRNFEDGDRQSFLELCKQFYESEATVRGYNEEVVNKTFKRVLDRHENLWGLIFIDADSLVPVGYSLLTSYWCNEDGGNVIILDELYISPINRHKGYGKIFMKWVEENYTDAVAITLEVLNTNYNACLLYDKAGFKPDGFITYTKPINKPAN